MAAYRNRDRIVDKTEPSSIIDVNSHNVVAALTEIITLVRTPTRRAADIVAYFDRPGTSNGPTVAINERLEQLRSGADTYRDEVIMVLVCR